MKYSAEAILNLFNNKTNLSDYLSTFLSLEKRGKSHICKCPFHNEKTPSFNINDEKGLFYCFGCGVGGNVFTFLQKYKNISFQESLKIITEYLGIKYESLESQKNLNNIQKYQDILKEINNFFVTEFMKSESAQSYLKKRGINLDSIKKFQIGLCPKNILPFKKFCISKGLLETDLKELGLLIPSKTYDGDFLRFQNRIIFPILNTSGKIVGFGGRTLINSKIKYINSSESSIFKKNEHLFGLWQNKNSIKEKGYLFMVEGYLDVISLYSRNINNSVATLGTSLSKIQIERIWSLVSNPIICFDGDEAGLKAMNQLALKILNYLKPGKTIKFMIIPDGEDPDSYVQKFGKEKFEKLANQSINLSDLIWNNLIDEPKNITPEYGALIEKKIKEVSSMIQDNSLSKEYFRFLSSKKNNHFWNRRKNSVSTAKINTVGLEKNFFTNEYIILSFLIFELEISSEFIEQINKIIFVNEKLENYRKDLIDVYLKNEEENFNFEEKLSEKEFENLSFTKQTHFVHLTKHNKRLFLEDILNNLRLPSLLSEREVLKKEILSEKQSDKISNNIKLFKFLSNEINRIKKKQT